MGGENNDVLVIDGVFGLREGLVGDDFSEGSVSGVGFWCEERHGFIEFGGESSDGIIL